MYYEPEFIYELPGSLSIIANITLLFPLYVKWPSAILTLFRMGFFGLLTNVGRGGSKKAPPLWNLSHISYNDETWLSYTSPKEVPKNIWITWHTPWVLLTSAFFHPKSANFAISRNIDAGCMLIHNFYLF